MLAAYAVLAPTKRRPTRKPTKQPTKQPTRKASSSPPPFLPPLVASPPPPAGVPPPSPTQLPPPVPRPGQPPPAPPPPAAPAGHPPPTASRPPVSPPVVAPQPPLVSLGTPPTVIGRRLLAAEAAKPTKRPTAKLTYPYRSYLRLDTQYKQWNYKPLTLKRGCLLTFKWSIPPNHPKNLQPHGVVYSRISGGECAHNILESGQLTMQELAWVPLASRTDSHQSSAVRSVQHRP